MCSEWIGETTISKIIYAITNLALNIKKIYIDINFHVRNKKDYHNPGVGLDYAQSEPFKK